MTENKIENKSDIQEDFEDKLTVYRNEIGKIEKRILDLKKHSLFNTSYRKPFALAVLEFEGIPVGYEPLPKEADPGEMLANIMLAYRHLEDARMRIGKIFQALDGGKSVYNR